MRQAVEDGYGELFSDSTAAETALGGTIYPAPLGTVSKQRPDGSWKHRLIQDLKANRVNAAVELPERMVLPRPVELATDLAQMAADQGPGDVIMVGIIDFADAFMSIPLAPLGGGGSTAQPCRRTSGGRGRRCTPRSPRLEG